MTDDHVDEQNTGKSHSLTANLQRVYALLRNHNKVACSICEQRRRHKHDQEPPSDRVKYDAPNSHDHCQHEEDVNMLDRSDIPTHSSVQRVLSLLEDEFQQLKRYTFIQFDSIDWSL
jgi:hypothetical protein